MEVQMQLHWVFNSPTARSHVCFPTLKDLMQQQVKASEADQHVQTIEGVLSSMMEDEEVSTAWGEYSDVYTKLPRLSPHVQVLGKARNQRVVAKRFLKKGSHVGEYVSKKMITKLQAAAEVANKDAMLELKQYNKGVALKDWVVGKRVVHGGSPGHRLCGMAKLNCCKHKPKGSKGFAEDENVVMYKNGVAVTCRDVEAGEELRMDYVWCDSQEFYKEPVSILDNLTAMAAERAKAAQWSRTYRQKRKAKKAQGEDQADEKRVHSEEKQAEVPTPVAAVPGVVNT